MPHTPSIAQLQAKAQAEARRLQAQAEQAARDLQQHMEHRVDCLSHHGRRPLSQAELERLGREGADFLRSRIR